MPKYVIEREIPNAGELSAEELQAISQKSCKVLNRLGPQIQWVQSYVRADKVYSLGFALAFRHSQRDVAGGSGASKARTKPMRGTANSVFAVGVFQFRVGGINLPRVLTFLAGIYIKPTFILIGIVLGFVCDCDRIHQRIYVRHRAPRDRYRGRLDVLGEPSQA